MRPGVVRLERTWLSRYLRQPAPSIVLDREQQRLSASAPVPAAWQTGFPAEYFQQLPQVVGRYPMGALFPRYIHAARRGITDPELTELDWVESPADARPVLTLTNRARHVSSRFTAPAQDVALLPADEWRTYLLIVNTDAVNAAQVGFGVSSDEGITLSALGGFIELIHGTAASISVQGVGGTAALEILEGRAWPNELCEMPCGPGGA